jgi:hypothetical protein
MNCPDKFTVRLLSSNSEPLENIILYIEIIAKKKSNYGIGPFITNNKGEVYLTKIEIEKEINNALETYIMDYSSRLEDCQQQIEIDVCTISDLDKILLNLKRYFPENAVLLQRLLAKSNNKKVVGRKDRFEVIPVNESVINILISTSPSVAWV